MLRRNLAVLAASMAASLVLAACDSTPAPVAAAAPKPPAEPRTFSLFFASGSTRLSPQAMTLVEEAAAAAKARPNARIACVGQTDTAGAAAYNLVLSRRRAEAVRDALVAQGIPRESITVSGRGEEELSVKTRDNISESQNRRVEVTVH